MLPVPQGDELFFDLALSFVPQIGDKLSRLLVTQLGSSEAVFRAPARELMRIHGLGAGRASCLKNSAVFQRAEEELRYLRRHEVQVLRYGSPAYPRRLLHCPDAPFLLYYKGAHDLNAVPMVAVIGTRRNTEYGQRMCEELVQGLAGLPVCIVSGLARGIDAIAHRSSLQAGLPTVGVLGHGLDRIYPAAHASLARSIQQQGGLLTEFPRGTLPDRGNFPVRNRVVAGMCDATVVVESDTKGGAMITAYLAHSYNREVMAIPGRVGDSRSSGCNLLIGRNMASLITGAADLAALMGWEQTGQKVRQQELALCCTAEEQQVLRILEGRDRMHADELLLHTGLDSPALAAALLQLELYGLVRSLSGKCYCLN